MLVHSYYEEDPRVRREAEALVAAGHDGGRLLAAPARRRAGRDARGRPASRVSTSSATRARPSRPTCWSTRTSRRGARSPWRGRTGAGATGWSRSHTPPDFLVAAALPLRLPGRAGDPGPARGRPGVLPVALARPRPRPGPGRPRRCRARARSRRRRSALSVNQARHERLVALGRPGPSKLRVVTNGPVLARFDPAAHPARAVHGGRHAPPRLRRRADAALRPGRRPRRDGAPRDPARPELPVELDLYGRGDEQDRLAARAADAAASPSGSTSTGGSPIDAVAGRLAGADIVLSPIRRTRFSEISLSTKAIEGAAMGKPVVAADMPTARSVVPRRGPGLVRAGRSGRAWPPRSCGSWTTRPARDAAVARATLTAREPRLGSRGPARTWPSSKRFSRDRSST